MSFHLGFLKFLGRSGVDANLVALGTQEEMEEMLRERRRLKLLTAEQREKLAKLKQQQASEESAT